MRIALWSLLGVALLTGVLWDRLPLRDAKARLDNLPLQGAGFVGQAIPLTEFEEGAIGKLNVIKRYYLVGNQPVFLTVIDGTHNRSAVHDPSYCYVGEGWHIVDRQRIVIGSGDAERVVLARPGETSEVLIWFSDGERRFASVIEYWYRATLRRLSLGYTGEEPVRVIMQPAAGGTPDWKKLVRDFVPLEKL